MMRSPRPDIVELGQLGLEYPSLIDHVLWEGRLFDSRLGRMREIIDLRLVLDEPEYCLVGRKGMSDAFAYEEITQLLAGEYHHDRLAAIVPRAADLITPLTAYGPRTADQLLRVEDELRKSPNSRRAVVYVGRPNDLTCSSDVNRAGEMPCTCIWQFHQREGGVLDMGVYMRSWDLVWGLSYDVPSFVAVQLALAAALDTEVGRYVHTSGSAHVYDRHIELDTWERYDSKLRLSHLIRGNIRSTQTAAREILGSTNSEFAGK